MDNKISREMPNILIKISDMVPVNRKTKITTTTYKETEEIINQIMEDIRHRDTVPDLIHILVAGVVVTMKANAECKDTLTDIDQMSLMDDILNNSVIRMITYYKQKLCNKKLLLQAIKESYKVQLKDLII